MKHKLSAIILTAMLLLFACNGYSESSTYYTEQPTFHDIAESHTVSFFTYGITFNMPYRLYVPEDISGPHPVLLFLHGAGERGDDNINHVTANSYLLDRLVGEYSETYPAIIIAPQCPPEEWWSFGILTEIMNLIDDVIDRYDGDPNRIYVTGLSMGGYGTFTLLELFPDRVAAAVPICGGGDPDTAHYFADVPIWIFHGAQDDIVDVNYSRNMAAALRALGSDVIYTEYPDVDHYSWVPAYNDPDLLSWMFGQSR